ncbi:MAG: sodium-dependent transporter, partial [Thermoanaerobaculia bacterium]|nr:sodium-dependent transporter [Thermoanaerobaculia bacterium]
LMDAGLGRRPSVVTVACIGLGVGLPSALKMEMFQNQDWVWGVGLMLSGLFFAVGAVVFGLEKLRVETVNGPGNDLRIGRWWTILVAALVPVEAVVLMVWWLLQTREWNPETWLDPTGVYTAGTVLAQWSVALVLLILANRWLADRWSSGRGESS